MEAAALILLRTSLTRPFFFHRFAEIYSVLTVAFCFSCVFLVRKKVRPGLAAIVLSSLLLRALLWVNQPLLSNDVHRYIWDGSLLIHGKNPIALAPADPSLSELAKEVPLPPDHREVASVYPPLSLLLFASLSKIAPEPLIFGVTMTLFDALSTLFLVLLLRKRRMPEVLSLLYAWHPLAIVESAHSAHVDSLGIFFLILTLYFLHRHPARQALSAAAAALTKIWPAMLLPLFLDKTRRSSGTLILSAFFFFIPVLAFWSHAGHFSGLGVYLQTWEFNGSVYKILRIFLDSSDVRRVSVLLFFFGWAACVYRRITVPSFSYEKGALFAIGLFLLLSPVVYPWYTLWLLPFLVFEARVEWIYFTLAIASSYAVLPNYLNAHVWREPVWPSLLTYLPLYGGLCVRIAHRFLRIQKSPLS
ncbi:MAG TPA: hypothetical protein VI895_14965 [Bdellovibrionota bacterium]|nr:hypothetical protein [Bdellovibrionota bacterium]